MHTYFPHTLNNGPKVKNNQEEINRSLRKHRTYFYSKVVSQKVHNLPEPVPLLKGKGIRSLNLNLYHVFHLQK